MSLSILKLPDANVVAANTRAVFNLPIGYTYHQLILTMGGTTFTKTHLSNMRLKMNGTVEQELGSGSHRETMNLFNKKSAVTNSQLVIDFERPGVHYPESRNLTVIGTGFKPSADQAKKQMMELNTLQLEVDIGAATAPTLELHAVVSAPQPLGVVKRIVSNSYSIPAGSFQIQDLPRSSSKYGQLDKIVIAHANVTSAEIRVDREVMQELTPNRLSLVQADGVRAAQAGHMIWDSTQEGFGAQTIPLENAQEFRIDLESSGADTITVYAEYLGTLR
jgi:hypothetical protein